MGQRKSIRRATTSKCCGNLGKNTQSTTELFQCTPSLQNRVQKQEDFHKGRITVLLALHNSMCFNTPELTDTLEDKSSCYCAPILGEYLFTTILKKSRVKSRYFSIIGTSKSVNSMGPPKMVNSLKDCIINGISIMIN